MTKSYFKLLISVAAASTAVSTPLVFAELITSAYSSRPGAPATLFLDFDGVTYGNWSGAAVGASPAYTADADASSWTAQELSNIASIWRRVAEKYSPFNINVTTVDPGHYTAGQVARVVIGGNGSWLGANPGGGVAAVGGFKMGGDGTTSWVFSANFGNSSTTTANTNWNTAVGEAAAHEAGHMFGLLHQSRYDTSGNLVTIYDWGSDQNIANSSLGVAAPIMGGPPATGPTARRIMWRQGWAYINDNVRYWQDDYAVLASTTANPIVLPNGQTYFNGFGVAPDDVGNTRMTAAMPAPTSITGVAGAGGRTGYVVEGTIENVADVDVFKFVVGAGGGSITLNRILVGPGDVGSAGGMLDAVLTLLDAAGNTIITINPASARADGSGEAAGLLTSDYGIRASISVPGSTNLPLFLEGGTYYIAVGSNGGYTDPLGNYYYDIGGYRLTIDLPTAVAIPEPAGLLALGCLPIALRRRR